MGKKAIMTGTPMDALDPRQRLAVELYTNPLLRTFGNKLGSARAAGYHDGGGLDADVCVAAIEWLWEQKRQDADVVKEYIGTFAMDAATAILEQLSATEGLKPMPMPEELLAEVPKPIIGMTKDGADKLLGFDDGALRLAREITSYNRAAATLMKESREVAKLILAYHIGTPGNASKGPGGHDDPLDLGALSDEQLRELAKQVQEVREMKKGIKVQIIEGVDDE
jgi:hypothetical protein